MYVNVMMIESNNVTSSFIVVYPTDSVESFLLIFLPCDHRKAETEDNPFLNVKFEHLGGSYFLISCSISRSLSTVRKDAFFGDVFCIFHARELIL